MNHLVISLIVLYAAAYCDATLFSWGSSKETKESKPAGYLPILKVHKYNGIQIDPIRGPPIYLPNEPNYLNGIEGQTTQLSQEQLQQFDVINRLATFLPSDDNLQEMDLSAVLPYVDLISEDSLEKFKYTVEANKPKEKSKILKFIAFLKHLKEKKLKPFKYVAGLGSSIVHKKKNWLFGSASTTTPEPYTETSAPITYPPYNLAYGPHFLPQQQFFNSFPTPAAASPSPTPLPSFNYFPQYPIYAINTEQRIPLENILPPQKQPSETAAESSNQPKTPPQAFPEAQQIPQFPANFQYPTYFPSAQFQPSPSPVQSLPPQPQYQYPSLPAASAEPAKNEITYEYKQTPAHTFATQDSQGVRQFASFNQAESPSLSSPVQSLPPQPQYQYPSLPAPSAEPAKNEITYEYKQTPAHTFATQDSQSVRQFASFNQAESHQSNEIPSFNIPQQSFRYPSTRGEYIDVNKFFTTSTNDLTAAGSENVEKIDQQSKPENSKNDAESLKINNAMTSTEMSVSKSSSPKRTILRPAATPARSFAVYPSSAKEENLKDDNNKSSTASPSTTN